ncbi:MAG: DUF3996 domain-containing protein [bacterium]
MVKLFLFVGLGAALFCGNIAAQDGELGLGIILGEPTGLSAKLWKTDTTAIDGAVAWSLSGRDALLLHVDYLFHNFNLFNVEKGKLPFYYGFGGRIKVEEDTTNKNGVTNNGDTRVGIRVPVGISYIFADAPVDIFLEIVPVLDLAPDTDFDLDVGIGVRYFLK